MSNSNNNNNNNNNNNVDDNDNKIIIIIIIIIMSQKSVMDNQRRDGVWSVWRSIDVTSILDISSKLIFCQS